MNKAAAMAGLASDIRKQAADSWLFPREPYGASGFWGIGPVMFIGDQPSKSEWNECNSGRRLFYGKLCKYGLSDAHLTDFYKKRGKGSALKNWKKNGLPSDWVTVHKPVLELEVAIVSPTKVIAISNLAYELVEHYMPTLRPILVRMMHFRNGIRPGYLFDFESSLMAACGIGPSGQAALISHLKKQGLSDTFTVRIVYGMGSTLFAGRNRQCAELMRALAASCPGKSYVTAECFERALNQGNCLTTRQQPCKVWRYYRKLLIRGGFIVEHCFAEV